MIKIFKSVITIAALTLIAIGATQSYFTDTETISSNAFTLGTLDLTIADESYQPIVLDNIKPGDVIEKQIGINNAGSIDFGSLMISSSNIDDNSDLLSQVSVAVSFTANSGTEQETTLDLGTTTINALSDFELITDSSANLIAGNSGNIVLTISIPGELGNEYQYASTSFDLTLTAEQVK